ncbi:MAG TPA: phage tail tape measure protein, partial [Candidatus Hydrothermia bacterium]|nr:phage tail tape measure protein [Candidatus Hydrothermia bacterium]
MADLFTIGIVLTAMDRASSVLRQMTNNSIADLKRLEEKFREVGEKMQSLGLKSMAAGALMAAPIQKAVSVFADLEEAQAFLKTTLMDETGAVSKEYNELLGLAEKLGTQLPGTTKDMIEMFIALREQGVQTKYILGGVGEAAAKFAVLMKLPYKEAATYVAKFQEALGVAEKDMIRFMDILQRGKFAAGIEVGDLAYTFRYLAPSLKTLNIQGVEAAKEITAVIGVMAANAIEGSTAGTSLAQALQRMAEVSHRLESKKLKELVGDLLDAKGIKLEFFTDEGQFKGIRAMIGELEKLRALSSQERVVVLGKLFGMEAARPLSVLVEKGLEGYEEMLKRMEKQADMQKKIAEITSTTKQRWDAFTGTLQNTISFLGGATAQALRLGKVFEFLNNVLDKVNDFMVKHKTLAGVIGAGIAVIGGLLFVVGGGLLILGTGVKLFASGIGAVRTFTRFIQIAVPWIRLKSAEILRLIGYYKMMDAIEYRGGFWKAMQYWLLTTKYRILESVGALRAWIAAQLMAFRANFLTIAGLQNMARTFGTVLVGGLRAAILGIRAFSIALLTTPVGWISMAIAAAALLIYKFWGPI